MINEVNSIKYLGHILSNDQRDDLDIYRQRGKLYARGNTLARKFSMCYDEVKRCLFRTFCSPMYTCHLWWNYTKAAIKSLHVAYNNVFRMLLRLRRDCSASNMFVQRGMPNGEATIRVLSHKFMVRLGISNNALIKAVLESAIKWCSRIRRHWLSSLYVHYAPMQRQRPAIAQA